MPRLIINGQPTEIAQRDFANFHGTSVFTTFRSQGGVLMLWREHWQRLSAHAAYFNFALPEQRSVRRLIEEHIQVSTRDQKIRIIIAGPDFAVSLEDYQPPEAQIYEGVAICFSRFQVHPQLASFKTGNSLPYVLAGKEAKDAQVFEAVLSDQDGHAVDGSRTSLMHYDGQTLTKLAGGLDGCMRQEALSYALRLGVTIEHRALRPAQLKGQLMLANSLIGVVPVGRITFSLVQNLVDRFRMDPQ